MKRYTMENAYNSKRGGGLAASVCALGLLIGLLTGCPPAVKPTEPQKVTITIAGDENVTVNEPKTLEVTKDSKWGEVKTKVNVGYKEGFAEAGWKLGNKDGEDLKDNYAFTENKTVFAVSKSNGAAEPDPEPEEPSKPTDPALFKTDGNGTITGYKCPKEDLPKTLVIPSKIGEEVITKIGEGAFEHTKIRRLDLSKAESLKSIAKRAFCHTKLKTIKFPASLERIEDGNLNDKPVYVNPDFYKDGAFGDCRFLEKVEFPENSRLLYIGKAAFGHEYPPSAHYNYSENFSVDLSNCTILEEIAGFAFAHCEYLKELKLPPSLKRIGRLTFDACGRACTEPMEELDLSACTNIKEIPRGCFDGFNAKKIKLPSSIETLEDGYIQAGGLVATFESSKANTIDLSACTSLKYIGKYSFFNCEITEVNFPPSVEVIGPYAFTRSDKISGVVKFPANLKTIKNNAFGALGYGNEDHACNGITGLDFSDCTRLETIEESAFFDCEGLKGTVKFPASLKTIGKEAFAQSQDCGTSHVIFDTIETLDFSACTALESIGEGAFEDCKALAAIDFSNCTSLKTVGENAFHNCTSLTSLDLSPCTGLKTIKKGAFLSCTGLTGLDLSPCTGLETIGEKAFSNCKEISGTVTFPASLKTIETEAFAPAFDQQSGAWLTKIQALDFSACTALESIGRAAFNRCSGITSIDFSNCTSLKTIGETAFDNCTSLTSLNLSPCTGLETIEVQAFMECKEISGTVTFPASLKTIKSGAFLYCNKITKLDFSHCAVFEKIENEAFQNCTALNTVHILDGKVEFYSGGLGAFYGCSALETVIVEKGDIKFSLNGSVVKNIILKEGVTSITGYGIYGETFSSCKQLENLDLSACTQLTHIGKSAFYKCTGLQTFILPPNLKAIGNSAFQGCTALTGLDLSPYTSLETIGTDAFENCTGVIGTVTFPTSLKTIESTAFSGCSNLQALDFSGCTSLETIGTSAFAKCTGIIGTVTFPASLKTIGKIDANSIEGTFSGCSNLQALDFSGCTALTSIGAYAFEKCTALTGLNLSYCSSLEAIGAAAFKECTGINGTVTFPASLKTVGKISTEYMIPGAFQGCSNLQAVDFSACTALTSIGNSAFQGCTALTGLDISFCTSLETIGTGAFKKCTGISGTVTFPASLKTIGKIGIGFIDGAFSGCSELQAVDFSGCTALTSIGNDTFRGCKKLVQADLTPCTLLTHIGEYAFSHSINAEVKLPDSINEIKSHAFGNGSDFPYCKTVTVSNYGLMVLVLHVGYPLDRIIIPGTVTEGGFSFADAEKTILIGADYSVSGNIKLPATTVKIGISVLQKRSITSLDFSDCTNLESIGEYAFYKNDDLTSADLSSCTQLKTIDRKAFYECKKAEISLPSGIETIEDSAFGNSPDNWCKSIKVLDNETRQKLINSGYTESRIIM